MHRLVRRRVPDDCSRGVTGTNQQRSNFVQVLCINTYIGLLCLGVFFSLLEPCHANPIFDTGWMLKQVLYQSTFMFAFGLIAGLLTAAFVEYWVVYLVLRRSLTARWPLFEAVVLINVVTMPPAQLLWPWLVPLADTASLPYPREMSMLAVEFLVVAAEFCLLKRRLAAMSKKGFLNGSVSDQRTLLAIGAANLASFVLMLPGLGLITAIMDATGRFISHLLHRL